MTAIAIFGLDPNTQASFDREAWNYVWRLAHDPLAPQADAVFEAHSEPIARKYGGEAYIERVAEIASYRPVYMLHPWPSLGTSVLKADFDYVDPPQSSIAFMFDQARHQAQAIGLFGVDMAAGEEYGYQRPDMAYRIGWYRAQGGQVWIDPASALLKSEWTGGVYGHPDNIDDMDYKLGARIEQPVKRGPGRPRKAA